MKTILYTAVAGVLMLSSCTTAYQTAHTPDDVYYSPRAQRTYAAANNNDQRSYDNQETYTSTDDSVEDGNYVTYQDEDQGDYSRRIDRFRNNYTGSYWGDDGYGSNVYVNNYFGAGGWGYGLMNP